MVDRTCHQVTGGPNGKKTKPLACMTIDLTIDLICCRHSPIMPLSFHANVNNKTTVIVAKSVVIDDQIHRATQILLDYKEKTENNRVPIVVTYNPQLNIIRKIARDLQSMLHTDTRLKQIFPELPLLFYRQPSNLRKMIVRSALPKTNKAVTFPCNSNRCEICKYILCKDQVAIPNTQKVYTILDHYWCASSNVVYMIICTRCYTGGIYIGETGQKLRTRMNHHRHKINTKSCDTPVGQHFFNQNHSLQDMQYICCAFLAFICILPVEGALVLRKLAMYFFYC
ncbi:hypothetical protein XELAEV_18006947mg [Xenopus laevis]|uniref:GIY-YIG domain-containing protein n=1 Tax=Xenopus laevis TaxID=8355 RepID=A0A974E0Q6_XENLA|nr:hypothetical protein XELAEV_18006947mg [Xenopus laevis]